MARNRNAFAALLAGLALLSVVPRACYAEGQITYGTQWWNQTAPEAKYQEFTDIPNGVFLEKFSLREMRNRNLLTFYGSGVQRSDEAMAGSWWNGARFRVDFGYRQVPHNLSSIARSPFQEVAPGTLVVPDTLQAANQANAAGYPNRIRDLLKTSPALGLGFRTDITNARLRARPARGWQLDLVGSRRMRSGRKPYGGGFSPGSGMEIWEPIAQRMLDGEARASYTKDRATFMATGGISEFTNEMDVLTWDNPAKLTGAQNKGRIDLYPDNRAVRGTLSAAYRMPKRTTFNGSIAVSRNTQNDPWIPFTVTATDPYSSLDSLPPAKSTHARVDVLTQDYRLTSHPVKDFGGTLRYRKYDYVNNTQEHQFFAESVADGAAVPDTFTVTPFGYKNQTYGIDLDYAPIQKVSLSGTAEQVNRTRTDREVAADREESVGGKVRVKPIKELTAETHIRHSRRWARTSDFSYEGAEQTALRRFDVADREQLAAGGGFNFSPTERLDLSGTFGYLFEKYSGDLPDSIRIGLRRIHQRNMSVDGTYHASANLDLLASVGWEQSISGQASRQSRTAAFGTKDSTWTARIKDEGLFGNAGIDWQAMPDRLGFSLGFDYSRAPGTFTFATASPSTVTAQSPPATRYRRMDFTLETTYHLAQNTEIGLRYNWEQFDVVDFSAVDIPQLGIATGASSINFIYLGDSFQSYRANRVGLVVNQRF